MKGLAILPQEGPMLASHGMRTFALLAAVALSACSGDESTNQPPDGDELPAFTAGDAQVSPAVRTAIAGLIVDLGTATGAAADPELAGVLGVIGAAVVGEGKITGVTAGSALRGSNAMALVDGTWESSAWRWRSIPLTTRPSRVVHRRGGAPWESGGDRPQEGQYAAGGQHLPR